MARESYFLFTIWGVLGFVFFRGVVNRDVTRRFGNSMIVWIGMLALVLFTALTWMGNSTRSAVSEAAEEMRVYFDGDGGGDEFVVVLEDDDFNDRASLIKEFNIQAEQNAAGGGIVIASGMSDFIPETDISFQQVFERADSIMYERKKELKGIIPAARNIQGQAAGKK